MNSNSQDPLAAEITRELTSLPELQAPETLVPRVLAALQRRSLQPWYRRSWQTWPAGLQWACLLVLLGVFGGCCFAGWKLSHTEPATLAWQRITSWISAAGAIVNALDVLIGSVLLMFKKLGIGFVIAFLAALGFAYALCLGLGTFYVRIAAAASAPFQKE